MITIVKGKEKIKCSYKTYDEQFRQLGYVPVSEPKKESTGDIEVKVSIKKDVEELVNNIIEEKKKELVEEEKEQNKTEEEKIGSKYGVRRRTSAKKEE